MTRTATAATRREGGPAGARTPRRTSLHETLARRRREGLDTSVASGAADTISRDGGGVLRPRQDDHLALVVARALAADVPRGDGHARAARARRVRAARVRARGRGRAQHGAPEGRDA